MLEIGKITALVFAFLIVCPLAGDQEAGNSPHVTASDYGRCYAKSVPEEYYGEKGVTKVFMVGSEADRLVHTFDWFSQSLYLACNVSDSKTPVGVSVVRLGPWPRGPVATAGHLAIAFYYKGKEVGRYSTLDIAGSPENVSRSVSHHTVIEKVGGFRRLRANEYAFDVETVDGRTLSFDPVTGEMRK